MRKLVEAQADMDRLEAVIAGGEYEDSALDDYNDALKVPHTALPSKTHPIESPTSTHMHVHVVLLSFAGRGTCTR